jgi:hypothetical protein
VLRAVNFVAFYAGWFAGVAGAGRGWRFLGPAVVIGLVALHLRLVPDARREALVITTVAVLGFCVDTLQTVLGVLAFGDGGSTAWVPPLWLLALWVIFATTLRVSFGWLAGRDALAATLGAVVGPLSYWAGVRLGAAAFPNMTLSFVALAFEWALMLPLAVWLAGPSMRMAPARC